MKSNRVSNVVLGLVTGLLATLILQSFLNTGSSQTIVLGVIAGLLVVLVLLPLMHRGPVPVEYKLVAVSALDEPALRELGKEGWNLAWIDPTAARGVFKR